MAKQSGLGDRFAIGGADLSGDVASLDQISGGPAYLDVTAINKSANERIGGLRDGDMQFTTLFNPSLGAEHVTLSTLPRTDVIATYLRGTTSGNAAACVNGKQVDYAPTRDNSGGLTVKVEVQANQFGLEWGIQLTDGFRADTEATTGDAFDLGAAGSHGAQAYLQLVSFTGTSVDVKIQDCATSDGTYADLIDFGSLTEAGAVRKTATGTVNEFLKVVTAGTFSVATFAVVIAVNETATVF